MASPEIRVGTGYDAHAFAPEGTERSLILGGVEVPHTRGLAGHSDADVLIHAIVDALLGAAGEGDIGTHFPSTDTRWKDATSTAFLTYTVDLLTQRGWTIGNIDATVVAERPKLAPHIVTIRTQLARLTGVSPDRISVKGKTTDHLGFTGREEGIACHAVALIMRQQ